MHCRLGCGFVNDETMAAVTMDGTLSYDGVISDRRGGWRAWIVQHLVPPSGVFCHAVAMVGFGFSLLVLHYVVLEELFSFRSARQPRKNLHRLLYQHPPVQRFHLATNLTVLAWVITHFSYTVHFHSHLILHQIFLQTIKKTLHLPRAAHTHTYWIAPKVHCVLISFTRYI